MRLHSVLMVLVQCSIVFVKVQGHFPNDQYSSDVKTLIKHWFLYISVWIINEFLTHSYKQQLSIVLTCSRLRSGKQPAL